MSTNKKTYVVTYKSMVGIIRPNRQVAETCDEWHYNEIMNTAEFITAPETADDRETINAHAREDIESIRLKDPVSDESAG